MKIFTKRPPLGTPENPEIIEPGQASHTTASSAPVAINGKLRMVFQIVKIMIGVSLPAFFFDLSAYWLFDAIRRDSQYLLWLPLILVAAPALFCTLLATVVDSVLAIFIVLILLGRNVTIPMANMQFGRFTNRPPY